MANEYALAAELKEGWRLDDSADDALINLALEASSRAVDDFCNRRFWQDPDLVTRYYTYDKGRVKTDDISTTVGLVVAVDQDGDGDWEDTFAATDYVLKPRNAVAKGKPYEEIWPALQPAKFFATGEYRVAVTAKFGWAAVPAQVKQATLFEAARLFKRKDAPFGVVGSPDMGGETRLQVRLDVDTEKLLRPLRIPSGA